MPWNFGPVERRMYDPKNDWPKISDSVKGKDDEGYVHKSAVLARYTSVTAGFFSMADIVLMPHKVLCRMSTFD
jgi:hypothetical protein